MQEISLSRGKVTIVDDLDYDWLMQWKWYAFEGSRRIWYAARHIHDAPMTIYMHREIVHAERNLEVDHIDRDGLHNFRINLRCCTHAQNIANQGMRADNSSGFKGVSFDKARNKWKAKITIMGHQIPLGRFSTAIEAAIAYDVAARKYFGEYARVNFPSK